MKIKRIVGMADNEYNNVIVELDNGFFAWVPTVKNGEAVDYTPSESDYAFSYTKWAKWVPLIVNGWVPPELFDLAMQNFKKLFEESPMDAETEKRFSQIRENPVWAEEESEAEEYCNREFDASGYEFMKELKEIFSTPFDPTGLTEDGEAV